MNENLQAARGATSFDGRRAWLPRITALVFILTWAWLISGSFRLYQTHEISAIQAERLGVLGETLRYLDEVLAGSAYMAVETGDLSWELRYRDNVGKLDQAVEEIKRLAPDAMSRSAARATVEANVILERLEDQAFDAVRRGDRPSARSILYGRAYKTSRAAYERGLKSWREGLQFRSWALHEHSRKSAFNAVLLGGVLSVFSLVLLLGTLRSEKQRYEALQKAADREAAFKASEASSRQILDAIGDMILVKGPQSSILWANRAFREYYGMSNEQLRDLIDAPFSEPDHTQQYIRDDTQVFSTGMTLDIPSEPVSRHDGAVRNFHTVKSAIRDASGNVMMTVGVSRDITDRSRLEAMARQSEKLAAIGQLAAGVAHEINNPLGVILGFAQGMEAEVFENHPLRLPVVSIRREAQRCKHLVQDLLTFSRTSNDDRKPLDLNRCVGGALALIEPKARVSRVEVRQRLAAELPLISGNENQIQQVVINLANNALDAMRDGGFLDVHTKLQRENGLSWTLLSIIDNGPGIPSAILPRIFEPFFTTKGVGNGTGLGLSLVHDIVQKHSSTIEVLSRPGHTEFLVKIPVR